jgi:hypothetical protein
LRKGKWCVREEIILLCIERRRRQQNANKSLRKGLGKARARERERKKKKRERKRERLGHKMGDSFVARNISVSEIPSHMMLIRLQTPLHMFSNAAIPLIRL